MAKTEFHIIKQDRHFDEKYYEVNGAMQGAFRIWMELEKKYLPSLPPGPFTKPGEYNRRLYNLFDEDALKDIWKIPRMKETEWNDRILMEIYMDKAYIAYADLHEVAEALRGASFASDNMKGQADVLDKIHDEHHEAEMAEQKEKCEATCHETEENCKKLIEEKEKELSAHAEENDRTLAMRRMELEQEYEKKMQLELDTPKRFAQGEWVSGKTLTEIIRTLVSGKKED